jgi:hypothetical protein
LLDLQITADVLRWVYSVGTEKPRPAAKQLASSSGGGFFSTLFSSFSGVTIPTPSKTPEPTQNTQEENLLESIKSSVLLTVYSARTEVRLGKKMFGELERATKKKPPSTTLYSLIYVSLLIHTIVPFLTPLI